MSAPQAILRFPGIQGVRSFSYTLSHGITPGVCQVEMVPQVQVPAEIGTMEIIFGQVRMAFPDCIVDAASLRRTGAGTIISLTILDRRWRWRYGEISGKYNVRKLDGQVNVKTEKTPRNLAGLCLTAMGETRYDAMDLPNKTRPHVEWVADNPATELAQLCESLGCRVVLGLDGRVTLRRMGQGGTLPSLPQQITQDYGIDPPIRPDKIKIVAQPSRYQTKFRLEPVGEDVDRSIVHVDELSYMPSGGWVNNPHYGFGNVGVAVRELATKSVYRWYRIKCSVEFDEQDKFSIPGLRPNTTIKKLWQLLPLENGLVATFFDHDGAEQNASAYCEGVYWQADADSAENTILREIPIGFSLDVKRGIVMFNEPVFRIDTAGLIKSAYVHLVVGHGVKDYETRMPVRFTITRQMPGRKLGTGPAIIHRDDLENRLIGVYEPDANGPRGEKFASITDNVDEVEKEANYYLDAAEAELQTLRQGNVTYAGIIPISPDGTIQQVAWASGPDGAVTQAGYNSEFSLVVPSWAERRQIERARAYNAAGRKIARKVLRLTVAGGGSLE